MKTRITLVLLVFILSIRGYGQTVQVHTAQLIASALTHTVAHFDVTDSTIVEALSKLSLERIAGLHLGIEEILRERFSDNRDRTIRFSLSLENATVRDIVEKLCQLDSRYTWSMDGSAIKG